VRSLAAEVSRGEPGGHGQRHDPGGRERLGQAVDGFAPLQVSGNTGPFQAGMDIDWHVVDPCLTINNLAHQQYRFGSAGMVTGTIGADDVEDLFLPLGTEPFIAGKSVFNLVIAPHADCATQ
jgi:hypothetical protein